MSTNEPQILTCDYCDQPATLVGRDSGDLLCTRDGRDQYTDMAASLAKLTPRTVQMYAPARAGAAEPVEPRPAGKVGCDRCPVCHRWILVSRTDSESLRSHRNGPAKCAGSGHIDTTPYVVIVPGARYHTTGRNQAEIIARPLRRKGVTHLHEPVPVEIGTNPHPTRRTP